MSCSHATDDANTAICVNAERAYLEQLDGSCRTPIGGLAELIDGKVRFRGQILTPDGKESYATERTGSPSDAIAMSVDAAQELLKAAGPDFFCQIKPEH